MKRLIDYKIIFEDSEILAVEKPTGLLTVPGIGPKKKDCLISRIQNIIPNALIVHRLDRDTSGVLILAKTKDSHRELSRQFHDREIEKIYQAIVYKKIIAPKGYINIPIRKDLEFPPLQKIDYLQGKISETLWETLSTDKNFSRVKLIPITGRSHQLRIHLCSIGHPILGDDLYGCTNSINMSKRLLLHSCSLSITHPKTLKRITFNSDIPF